MGAVLLLSILFSSLTISAAPLASHGDAIVFDPVSAVTYEAHSSQEIESFLNIRFGQDTRGENRFAPPLPFSYPRGSIVNATVSGAACPQPKVPLPGFPLFSNVTSISEDCLTLRVDRPAGTKNDSKLPVMVWIFGGGDSIGQIYDSAYDPAGLIVGSKAKGTPVIYAAMNYRLGFLGWSAFKSHGSTARPNVGLLDQRLALEWIQKHIAAFGGDPENVTIFGQSDGGTSVGLHITAYGGSGPALFKRAILQSGSPTADAGTASHIVFHHTKALTKRLNCSGSVDTDANIKCLRSIPLDKLLPVALAFNDKIDPFAGLDVFIPTVDGSIIPDAPSKLLKQGRFKRDIDTMIGWCENDAALFIGDPQPFANSSFIGKFIASQFGAITPKLVRKTLKLYPSSDPLFTAAHSTHPDIPVDFFRASQIVRDSQYSCTGILAAQSFERYNSETTSTYLYTLNATLYSAFLEQANLSYLGVIHGSDNPYVFNQAAAFRPTNNKQIALSNRISGTWANFATGGAASGKLKGSTVRNWPEAFKSRQGEDHFAIQVIGGPEPRAVRAGTRLSVKSDFQELGRRCAFWNSPELLAAVQV